MFLKQALTAGASFYIVPRHVLGGPGYTPPSEVITRAVIGTGGMGLAGHVTENKVGQPPQTLAVCDVDEQHLAAAVEKALSTSMAADGSARPAAGSAARTRNRRGPKA
jgi:hypothetical protein